MKQKLREGIVRAVQSLLLAAELAILADLLFALGERGLPRSAFWFLFGGGFPVFFALRGFSRKARRTVILSAAGAAVLALLAVAAAWRALLPAAAYKAPETEPKAIFAGRRVLAVVPHEDDEFNLLGGVLEEFTAAGSEVYVVFVSTGDAAGRGEERVHEAIRSLALSGVPEENVIFLGYGDGVPEGGIHIYNAAPDAVTPSLSGRTETHAAPGHPARREGVPYTRENLLADLRGAIGEIRADVIFCADYDENIDHRATALFFDEALGRILAAEPDYAPLVLKGFAYSTAFHAPADFFASVNLRSTARPASERMENGVYLWEERVRLPVDAAGLSRSLYGCRGFAAAEAYESQKLWRLAPRIINGDKVFWQRRTDSLLYGAEVRVSSGNGAELCDFRLLHSSDLALGVPPYEAVWIPESGDEVRKAVFSFPAADITEIRLYDNPSPEDNVLAAEIVFSSGNRYEMSSIDPAGTAMAVEEPDCTGFIVRLLETEGAAAGLTEVEAYRGAQDALPPYSKLADADGNFVYDFRLSGAATEAEFTLFASGASDDPADYVISCAGEGCAAELRNGRIFVSCPRGRDCIVTVSDESGTLSDSVYIAHETAALRFVRAVESYFADDIPKTNLYSLAAYCYKHFILGWE